ncbi:MAG TPA: rhodanese-like domain-containing protein [Pseudorhizobium sp.]|nr:rhodanese-like domain-containing protein [Pseudorhizobium sp.]
MDLLIRALRSAALPFMVWCLMSGAPTPSPAQVPEPEGLWPGPMRGETPEGLAGATVLDLRGLKAIINENVLLLDVGLADKKPDNFPEDRLWLPTHRSIPGAVWLPGAGASNLDAKKEAVFFRRVEELTQGDRAKPIVTFCRPKCWGSWNTGKRLVMAGYTNIHWFPGGIDEWQEVHEVVEIKPDAASPEP